MRPAVVAFAFTLTGFFAGAAFFIATSLVLAWTGPTSAPPNANVSAPINVGTTDQIKNAGLGINSLAVFGNAILSGASHYLNFGTTAGSSGYGIRDNAGTMEFKNTGGSWQGLLATSSTFTQIKFADGTTQTTAMNSSAIISCPAGWTMVGDAGKTATYCIETGERTAAPWLGAKSTCDNINDATYGRAHLCDHNEWYKACVLGGPTNMTNNYEWVADHGDGHDALRTGSGSCDSTDNYGLTSPVAFRCCLP